jgi:Nucleotidyltransferase of unknown function (DUF6036)
LRAVDEFLSSPATITIVGGTAIALYGVQAGTTDVDTWETDLSSLESAIAQARAKTGLNIPVSTPEVVDVPYDCGSRLQPIDDEWTQLRVMVLEPHDLALSRTLRGNEHDLSAIEKLHQIRPLVLETLLTRYLGEMDHVIGNFPDRLDLNFALMVGRLFGEIAADDVEEQLRLHRARTGG